VSIDCAPGDPPDFLSLTARETHDDDDLEGPARVRLLIVEDDPFIALHLEMLVESWGYAVVGVCVTGSEAITMAELHRPEVILSDVKLLGPMDGIEAAAKIFERQSPKVIFLTAFHEGPIAERMKALPNFGILPKPLDEASLREALARAQASRPS
jgi:CheY-like chemotaxis protein